MHCFAIVSCCCTVLLLLLQKDVIVISCDLISDVAMHHLADIHRSYDASVTALLAPVVQTSADREAANIAKAKKKTETETCEFFQS